MFLFEPGVDAQRNRARRSIRLAPRPGDLVAILEALREAGALRAQLIVI